MRPIAFPLLLLLARLLATGPALAQQGPDESGNGTFDEEGPAAATYDELAAAPPALPPSLTPLSLHAALTERQRATLDREQKVVTFAQRISRRGDRTDLVGVSLGTVRHPPDAIRSVLAAVNDYPSWLMLQPSYKSVRVQGASGLVVGIGSTDKPQARRQMTYSIEPSATGARWVVVDSGTSLQAGSNLEFIVAPHPTIEGASLIAHVQTGLLPDGRMLKYLSSDDTEGRNRWWKDCNRHARRLHWAIDAAASEPPGDERRKLYVSSFQREFRGKTPAWAER